MHISRKGHYYRNGRKHFMCNFESLGGGGGVIHINNMCSKVTIVFEWVYIWGQEAGLIFEGLWYGKAMCKAPNEAISGFIVST
jgi:hypothetical protein